MTQKDKHKQIFSEKNTYFSSLISQKENWTIEEILNISKDLLTPFKNLKETANSTGKCKFIERF